MKNLFQEYGDLFVGIVTTVMMLSMILGGVFIGTNVGAADATPHESKGVMNAMGYEASKTDIGVSARKEMIADVSAQEVDVNAGKRAKPGEPVEVKSLFRVVDKNGKRTSYRVLHIYDEEGKEILATENVPTVGTIVFPKPGVYRCILKLTEPSMTKIVTLHVTE